MALDILSITDAVMSHAMASGHFERVNGHESENPPGHGLTASVWSRRTTPVPRRSGLNSVSVRLVFNVQIEGSMQMDPPDAIDPNMLAAVDALCAAYAGDFTLGGVVAEVDLLGQYGEPLDVVAGYLPRDGALYRVMTISLPVVVNDLWTEAP